MHLQVENKKQKISFKKLYATKEVQQSIPFNEAKEFLKRQSLKHDIFIQMIEEKDENKMTTKKFLVMAKAVQENVFGKTKTRFLNLEHLKKAVLGAVNIVETKKKKPHNEEFSEDIKDLSGERFQAFESVLGRLNRKK